MQSHRPKPKLIATCKTIFTEISSNKPKCRQAISEILNNQIYFRQKLITAIAIGIRNLTQPIDGSVSTFVYIRCMKTLPLQQTYCAIG